MQNLIHKSKEWAGTAAIAYYKYLSELFGSSSVCQLECSCSEREVRYPSSLRGETTQLSEHKCTKCPGIPLQCFTAGMILRDRNMFHHFRQRCQSSAWPGWSTQVKFRLLSVQSFYKWWNFISCWGCSPSYRSTVLLLSGYNLQNFLLVLPGTEWLGIVPALSSCICDKTHPITSHIQLSLSGYHGEH